MTRQIFLNGKGTFSEFGAYVLNGTVIESAQVRSMMVDLPGVSGSTDLTEALTGEPMYDNRKVSFSLILLPDGDVASKRAAFENAFNGKRVKIELPDDDHYFIGRVSTEFKYIKKDAGTIFVNANCDPWRYNETETTVDVVGTGADLGVLLENEFRPINPSITCSAPTAIKFGDTIYNLNEGTKLVPGIRLLAGENNLTVNTANGETVAFSYQEASL
jgi:hypothetical protein